MRVVNTHNPMCPKHGHILHGPCDEVLIGGLNAFRSWPRLPEVKQDEVAVTTGGSDSTMWYIGPAEEILQWIRENANRYPGSPTDLNAMAGKMQDAGDRLCMFLRPQGHPEYEAAEQRLVRKWYFRDHPKRMALEDKWATAGSLAAGGRTRVE